MPRITPTTPQVGNSTIDWLLRQLYSKDMDAGSLMNPMNAPAMMGAKILHMPAERYAPRLMNILTQEKNMFLRWKEQFQTAVARTMKGQGGGGANDFAALKHLYEVGKKNLGLTDDQINTIANEAVKK
jgi:hypothetical protein